MTSKLDSSSSTQKVSDVILVGVYRFLSNHTRQVCLCSKKMVKIMLQALRKDTEDFPTYKQRMISKMRVALWAGKERPILPKLFHDLYLDNSHSVAVIAEALDYASVSGDEILLQRILQGKRICPSIQNNQAIRKASKLGHDGVVKLLLQDKRVNPRERDSEALRAACCNGHYLVVKLLLQDKRANPGAMDSQALKLAVNNGYIEITRLLLQDRRVDPKATEDDPMKTARTNAWTEVAKLNHWRNTDSFQSDDRYPINDLIADAYKGKRDRIDALLLHPRVNQEEVGAMLLSRFAGKGLLDAVKHLLKHKCVKPEANDNRALVEASKNGHEEVVDCLLGNLYVNASANNPSLIRRAVQEKNELLVKKLLEHTEVGTNTSLIRELLQEASGNMLKALQSCLLSENERLIDQILSDPKKRADKEKLHLLFERAKKSGNTSLANTFWDILSQQW